MDVVVEVGGWVHACCGPAVERDQSVDVHPARRSGVVVLAGGPSVLARVVGRAFDRDVGS